jgi:hypothetical protein
MDSSQDFFYDEFRSTLASTPTLVRLHSASEDLQLPSAPSLRSSSQGPER